MDSVLLREPAKFASLRRRSVWLRPNLPEWWAPALTVLLFLYSIVLLFALAPSWLTQLDEMLYGFHAVTHDSSWYWATRALIFLGQRVPALLIVGIYVVVRVRQTKSWEPFVLYIVAAAGFVGSVAAVKYGTGRIGPRFTSDAVSVWAGGNVFPSGHVTGTVVLYGVAALVAPAAHRRLVAAVAVMLSIGIGFGTIAIDTHWFSDVLGAWLNGPLVLLIAWAILPEAHGRFEGWRLYFVSKWRSLRSAEQVADSPAAVAPGADRPAAVDPGADVSALSSAAQQH